jgi:hypothetical protein
MSDRTSGRILLVAGVLCFLVSATADSIGVGGAPGIGWKQVLGMVVGVALAAVGMVTLRAAGRS